VWFVFGVLAVTAGIPVPVALIVGVASRREDKGLTVGYRPSGGIQVFARRLVNFSTDTSLGGSMVQQPRSL
jgi:hypothetical protein